MSTITAHLTAVLFASLSPGPPPDSIWTLIDAAVTATESQRKALLSEAEVHARAALSAAPQSIERRYELAAVLGMRANTEGGQSQVRAAAELHERLVEILEADSGHVGARHLLGRLHAGVRRMSRVTRWVATNLLGGGTLKSATWKVAEENLAYAERLAPEVPDHHLQLALLYRDTDRPELAAEEVRHVMALQARSALDLAVQAEASGVWAQIQD